MLLATSEKERRKTNTLQKSQISHLPAQTRFQRFRGTKTWRYLVTAGEAGLLLLGLGQAFVTFRGPFWPTEPTFLPGAPSLGSPMNVPFFVTNKSAVFSLDDLLITCGPLVVVMTGKNVFNIGRIGAQGHNVLRPLETRPFTCRFNRVVSFPGAKVEEAHIQFTSAYKSPWPWEPNRRVVSTSSIFTLETATDPPQWMEGVPLK